MTDPVNVPREAWGEYKRSQIAHLRPYIVGESLSERVSISMADLEAGSPKAGDMVARNPANHEDQWLVAAEYFSANFEPAALAAAPKAEPVAFGHGMLVVDTGTYGGEPAVFIAKAKAAGRVGELTGRDYFDRESLQPGELVLQFPTDTQAKSVADALVGSPAPASDELLEALAPICREADCWPELADDDVLSFTTPEGSASPYDIKMGDIRRIAAIAKHKGPQS